MREHIIGRFPRSILTAFIIAIVMAGRAAVGFVMPSPAAGPRQSFAPTFGASSGIVIVSPTPAPPASAGGSVRIETVPPAAAWPAQPPTSEVHDATGPDPVSSQAL